MICKNDDRLELTGFFEVAQLSHLNALFCVDHCSDCCAAGGSISTLLLNWTPKSHKNIIIHSFAKQFRRRKHFEKYHSCSKITFYDSATADFGGRISHQNSWHFSVGACRICHIRYFSIEQFFKAKLLMFSGKKLCF